ncbi:MAG: T9SS type A sorting domain-containing protein [Fibrobacterota bacterium]
MTDNTFPSGGVGVAGLGGVTINFDDFRVAAAVEEPLVEREANVLIPTSPTLTAIPNPFNPRTRIQVNGIGNASFKLCLYDAQGHRISKWEGKKPSVFTWDAGTLPPGIYFARLVCGRNMVTQRLVLLR